MNRIKFFLEGVRYMRTRGSVTPTSRYTSNEMLSHIDFSRAHNIFELGSGDGKITRHILSRMGSQARLFCFEINPEFCRELREIDDPRLTIFHENAMNLDQYVEQLQLDNIDYIVSGLPFVMLPREMGDEILEKSKKALGPGGRFVQFHYSLIPKKRYIRIFDTVKISFEVRNLPPAFVFVCS